VYTIIGDDCKYPAVLGAEYVIAIVVAATTANMHSRKQNTVVVASRASLRRCRHLAIAKTISPPKIAGSR